MTEARGEGQRVPLDLTVVILAGGHSRRFGSPKAMARFQGQTFLQRLVSLLEPLAEEILVVAQEGSPLPDVLSRTPLRLVWDAVPEEGPLRGIATGLAAARTGRVYVTPVDAPATLPRMVEWMVHQLGDTAEAVAPVLRGRAQPLQVVLRREAGLAAALAALEEDPARRAISMLERLELRTIEEPELRVQDPELLTFRQCNTPEELQALEADWIRWRAGSDRVRS